jgi:hypothetical protein
LPDIPNRVFDESSGIVASTFAISTWRAHRAWMRHDVLNDRYRRGAIRTAIRFWVEHPGGRRVIVNVQDALHGTEREVRRLFGAAGPVVTRITPTLAPECTIE